MNISIVNILALVVYVGGGVLAWWLAKTFPFAVQVWGACCLWIAFVLLYATFMDYHNPR